MIARAGSGWQTVLADLSLILFMVTAAALAQAEEEGATARAKAQVAPLSPQGEPLAVYRAGDGAPPLTEWLASQSPDARQQMTIVAQYPQGRQTGALHRVIELAAEAGAAGARARIVVEPGSAGTVVSLAYDDPRATLARGLQGDGQKPDTAKDQP